MQVRFAVYIHSGLGDCDSCQEAGKHSIVHQCDQILLMPQVLAQPPSPPEAIPDFSKKLSLLL
jgi:hypothetical protein